jgi:hypothetical protein
VNKTKHENDKQSVIEDLPVDETQQNEVSGGFTPDGKQLVVTIKDGPAAARR